LNSNAGQNVTFNAFLLSVDTDLSGRTISQIKAVSGHSSSKVLEGYIQNGQQTMLANASALSFGAPSTQTSSAAVTSSSTTSSAAVVHHYHGNVTINNR